MVLQTLHHRKHPAPTQPQISKNGELEAGRDRAAPEPSMGLFHLLLERMDLEQERGDGDGILGCCPHTAQGAPQHPVATQPQNLPKMGTGRDGAEPFMSLLQLLHEASKGPELRPSWKLEEAIGNWKLENGFGAGRRRWEMVLGCPPPATVQGALWGAEFPKTGMLGADRDRAEPAMGSPPP